MPASTMRFKHGCRQFFSGFTKDQAAFFIDDILCKDFSDQFGKFFFRFDLNFACAEKFFDDIGIGGIAQAHG